MKSYFLLTDIAEKAEWDKPIEFPKPEPKPEMPVRHEPITPDIQPEPVTIPNERPKTEEPKEIPGQG